MGILRNDRLVQNRSVFNHCTMHHNGVADLRPASDHDTIADDGIGHLSADLCPVPDQAPVQPRIRRNVLRRNDIILRIDLPELLVQIEFRHDIDQLHVGFPVRAECPDILPVTIEFICAQIPAAVEAVRNDMLAKITVFLL